MRDGEDVASLFGSFSSDSPSADFLADENEDQDRRPQERQEFHHVALCKTLRDAKEFYSQNTSKDDGGDIAASSIACSTVPADAMSSTSSAAKPATDQLQPCPIALESTTLTLPGVLTKLLEGNYSNPDTQRLLEDIPVLQEWQHATRPSHKVRDAMMKLASHWNVSQKVKGKKRSPSEVAQDMEENIIKRAKLVLANSTMSSSSSDANPATEQLRSAVIPTTLSLSSAGRPATNQLHRT